MTDRFRIRQDGQTLAKTTGPHALREIMYAAQALSGSLEIQRAKGKRWAMYGVRPE